MDFTADLESPDTVETTILRLLYPGDGDHRRDPLTPVADAVASMQQAHQDRDEAIRAAHAGGETIAAISRAAGMTRQSIYTILGA